MTRVVHLLDEMKTSLEKELKHEEEVYDKFDCWGKGLISQKEKSHADALARTNSLQSYVDDVKAGEHEFTTERVDLEKEIADLGSDLDNAEKRREHERKEYEDNKNKLENAIDALKNAQDVLRAAGGGTEGSLLDVKRRAKKVGFAKQLKQARLLEAAVKIGDQNLGKGDAVFLRRLLTGDVPEEKDWKKLNKEADFKKKYEARSGDILATLGKLQESFEQKLKEDEKSEADTKITHDKLAKTKAEQKTSAETALLALAQENGARAMAISEAEEELEALKVQMESDTKTIKDVRANMVTKAAEWGERSVARQNEIKAISEAISILHSDDARDALQKTLGRASFIQESSKITSPASGKALDALRKVSLVTADVRLASIAQAVKNAASGQFDEVVKAIDDMLGVLVEEDSTDLKRKEQCEEDRQTGTRSAHTLSIAIDEHTDAVTKTGGEIQELSNQITETQNNMDANAKELSEMDKLRKEEKEAFLSAQSEDKEAALLVERAKSVLAKFYEGLALAQNRANGDKFLATAVAKDPPPTWKNPYGGKKSESQGIIAILDIIHEDIMAAITAAEKVEEGAVKSHEKLVKELNNQSSDLAVAKTGIEQAKNDQVSTLQTATNERRLKAGELQSLMEQLKASEKDCAYYLINYGIRVKNRQIEADGLRNAKTILLGGKLDAATGTFLERRRGSFRQVSLAP